MPFFTKTHLGIQVYVEFKKETELEFQNFYMSFLRPVVIFMFHIILFHNQFINIFSCVINPTTLNELMTSKSFILFIPCIVTNGTLNTQTKCTLINLDIIYYNSFRLIQHVSIPPGVIIRDSYTSKIARNRTNNVLSHPSAYKQPIFSTQQTRDPLLNRLQFNLSSFIHFISFKDVHILLVLFM